MKNIAYYNGTVGDISEITIPFCDRVCFFGDGVYDATYSRNGKIFNLEEHVKRLFFSAEKAEITPRISYDETLDVLRDLVKKSEEKENFVYLQFTRGTTVPRNHIFISGKSNVWVSVTPKNITPKEKKMALMTVPDTRYELCEIKTLNLLPNVLCSNLAAKNGCDEGVFCSGNLINECAHSNIHMLKNGVLVSPPPGKKVLGGIARKNLIAACKKFSVPVEERHFTVEEAESADELFITSAGTLLSPCYQFDGKKAGGKGREITDLLQNELYGEFYAATE